MALIRMDPTRCRVASELAKTSACLDRCTRSRLCRSDLLAIEVGHEGSIAGANKLAGAAEHVDLTRTAKELLASRGGSGVLDGEEATSGRGVLNRSFDTGERIALSENLSASRDLEGVASVVLPTDRSSQHGVSDIVLAHGLASKSVLLALPLRKPVQSLKLDREIWLYLSFTYQ